MAKRENGPMPHAFDPLHPALVRVRQLALGLPGAAEKLVVGHPAFYTRKVFAYFGMSYKTGDTWTHNPVSVSVLLPDDERLALLEEARCFVPGYIGPAGFVGVLLDDATDWEEIAELLEESFRLTAGTRLVAALDGRHRSC